MDEESSIHLSLKKPQLSGGILEDEDGEEIVFDYELD